MVYDLAKEFKTPTPMSAQAAALFRILNSKGYDKLDILNYSIIFGLTIY